MADELPGELHRLYGGDAPRHREDDLLPLQLLRFRGVDPLRGVHRATNLRAQFIPMAPSGPGGNSLWRGGPLPSKRRGTVQPQMQMPGVPSEGWAMGPMMAPLPKTR